MSNNNKRSDKGRDEINLRNLRRMDDSIKDILSTASAVTVYQFSIDDKKWDKLPIEGPLHIVRRSTYPRTALIVMNRLDTQNLVQPITKDTDVKIELPYLMLKNLEKGIFCIWFYINDECQEIASLLMSEISSLTKNGPTSGGGGGGGSRESFVDTLAKIGIKNVTVSKSASKGLDPCIHSDGKNLDPSELMSTPSNNVDKQKLENGGRSVNVQDLFAQVSLAQGGGANISQSSISADSRHTPRTASRNKFAPINLIYDLERAKTDESGEPLMLAPSDTQEDEMLTPAMIKERSNKDKPLNKEDDRQPPVGIFSSPDLVPSIDDSFIYGAHHSSQQSNHPDHSRHQSSLTTNRSLNQSNIYDPSLPTDQLKNVLIHLIQTDSEFVAKIRAALIANQHQSSY